MEIKLLLMDADDTVLDFRKSEIKALTRLFALYGITLSPSLYHTYDAINTAYWKSFERGAIARNDLLIRRFDDMKAQGFLPLTVSSEEINYNYFSFLKDGGYRVLGIGSVIKSLKEQGIIISLASNGIAHIQRNRLRLAKLTSAFDKLFISEEIGYQKPDARFFAPVFSEYPTIPKDQIAIVGDSLSSDIQGGVNAGIRTIWFNCNHEENNTPLVPDLTISKITELKNLSTHNAC